jgi:two-component system, NtrC family, sensor histidine kinase PilS
MSAAGGQGRERAPGGRTDLRFLLQVLMVFRVLAITLFLGVMAVAQVKGTRLLFFAPLSFIYSLVIAVYAATILFAVAFNRLRDDRLHAALQIGFDLILATLIVFLSGAHLSPYAFLFIFPILWAAVALPGGEAYLIASAASILHGGVADLAWYGILLPPYREQFLEIVGHGSWDVIGQVSLNIIAFFAVAFLGRQMARRYRRTEKVLNERTIDLERLRRLHGLVFDSIGSGIVILDREGRVTAINPAGAATLGVERFGHQGAHVASLFGAVPIGDLCLQASRGSVDRWEGRMVNAAGARRTLGLSISRLRDPSEEEGGYVVIFQDLTDLRDIEAQLKRAEKLSAVGRMAASIAHEIRNPLASMSGSIQLLRQNPSLGGEDRALMEIVLRETGRLNGLVGDFLSYARPPSPQLAAEDLSRLTDETVRFIAGTAPPGATLRTLLPAETVRGEVDAGQYRQILLNLVKNGLEALEGEGEVVVSLAAGRSREGREGVELSVADSGRGIDEKILPEIFEPFRTTKPEGTGLGLAIVYQLVTAHGGTVDASGRPGRGSVFTVFLPAGREA